VDSSVFHHKIKSISEDCIEPWDTTDTTRNPVHATAPSSQLLMAEQRFTVNRTHEQVAAVFVRVLGLRIHVERIAKTYLDDIGAAKSASDILY
jgi:hypothetical protein